MILYKHHRKGLFNGYINTPRIDTVEAVVEKVIFGEDEEWFLETDKKEKITEYDENFYVTGYRIGIPIGIHKSRFIKWTSSFQLNLFES